MHWLAVHLQFISIGVSICTLLVWFFYARLLQMTFRRNERSMILGAVAISYGTAPMVVGLQAKAQSA